MKRQSQDRNRLRADLAMKRAEKALDFLARDDYTMIGLAKAMGVSRPTADRYLRGYLKGRVHIDRWEDPLLPGRPLAVWALGAGEHAPLPTSKADLRLARACDNRPDETEEWFDERARQLRTEIRPFRSPMDTAFFGAAA